MSGNEDEDTWVTYEDVERGFKESERRRTSDLYANYSVSTWTSDAPTESPVLYRIMNKTEADIAHGGQQLAPIRKGDHGQKYLSEVKEKVEGFVNMGDQTPVNEKLIVRYKLEKEEYPEYRGSLINQTGAKGSSNDLWHREGLGGDKGKKGTAPSEDFINVGVKPSNFPIFNDMIVNVKRVKPK